MAKNEVGLSEYHDLLQFWKGGPIRISMLGRYFHSITIYNYNAAD